jgi:hypothetical protein
MHSLSVGVLALLAAWLRSVNEVTALRDHCVFNFDSTWLLEQNTMDKVANLTASTRPRGC